VTADEGARAAATRLSGPIGVGRGGAVDAAVADTGDGHMTEREREREVTRVAEEEKKSREKSRRGGEW
jgi:hypothetical protein